MRAVRAAATGLLVAGLTAITVAMGPRAHAESAPPAPATPVAGLSSGSGTVLVNRLTGSLVPRAALQALAFLVVPADQLWAFNQIISHESSWNPFAVSPAGAYGLGQALPAEKMADEAPDWLFNPLTQLRWAYRYMNERYGSPAAAWDFWQAHHWY
jgi:hypothetical protein